MFNAWLAFTQLTSLSKMHKDEKLYLEHLVDGYSKEAMDKKGGKGTRRNTPVARRVSFTLNMQLEVRACVMHA